MVHHTIYENRRSTKATAKRKMSARPESFMGMNIVVDVVNIHGDVYIEITLIAQVFFFLLIVSNN